MYSANAAAAVSWLMSGSITITPVSPSTMRHEREVEPAQLVDPGHDLEETVFDQQLPLPPQARVGRVGRLGAAQERVRVEIPDHSPVGREDLPLFRAADEAAGRVFEVLAIVQRERRSHRFDAAPRDVGDGLGGAHVGFPLLSRSAEVLVHT